MSPARLAGVYIICNRRARNEKPPLGWRRCSSHRLRGDIIRQMLTPKRQAVAREYAVSGNGTASAIAVGYAPGSAHVEASKRFSIGQFWRSRAARQRQVTAYAVHMAPQRKLSTKSTSAVSAARPNSIRQAPGIPTSESFASKPVGLPLLRSLASPPAITPTSPSDRIAASSHTGDFLAGCVGWPIGTMCRISRRSCGRD